MKNSSLYSNLLRPLLFRLDPEFAHRQAIRAGNWLSHWKLGRRLLRKQYCVHRQELCIQAAGLEFQNPVGLAAGFDKHGNIYPVIADLGFGHMEIGSVSALPWRGNPSPTLLRLPQDGGLINRPGLNSEGSSAVYRRLKDATFDMPTGINIVKTADPTIAGACAIDDYLSCFSKFHPLADFITLNLSCPNTSEGRTFEDPETLAPFLYQLKATRASLVKGNAPKPIFIKLSPDLDDEMLFEILSLAREVGIEGCVVSNTTVHRENLKTSDRVLKSFGFGGVSGRPLKRYVHRMIHKIRSKIGVDLLIIACGGVGCDPEVHPAEEVWQYLNLGATMVQLHTGLIYRGPGIASLINNGLLEILQRENIPSLKSFLAKRDTRRTFEEPVEQSRN